VAVYFAYGSNMSSRAIAGRCPSARPLGRAALPDHELIFFLDDASWRGGVAGVLPAPGRRVEGVLYALDEPDLRALDDYEDVAAGDYVRARREVHAADGSPRDAWIYLPGRDADVWVRPSRAYLRCLLEGAREHGLSAAYRDALARTLVA